MIKCPKCSKGVLYRAFTLAGDIGWCLKCNYKTEPIVKTKQFTN